MEEKEREGVKEGVREDKGREARVEKKHQNRG